MCGIAGILSTSQAHPNAETVRAMVRMIRHRGPDDQGYFEQGPVALGHCRLSIIDLKSGRQPIFNETGDICVVYNGEIYNFPELRTELEGKGHVFSTDTDTEVIVHAYEEYGLDSFRRFNGMYAFALWDGRSGELLLCRDRLGIKPLYVAEGPWGLAFASEIKAFLAMPEFRPRLNKFALADFVMYQNILDDKTFFESVTKLRAGHYATARAGGPPAYHRFWDLEFPGYERRPFDDVLDEYRTTFEASVRRHLISDVPVGCHLSGGFDSTSVAAMAMRITGEPMTSFTGYFSEGAAFDEREYSRRVIERTGVNSQEIHITHDDFRDNLARVVYHLDEPSVGSGALPQYMVAASEGGRVKVTLTGHGGDEFFAGYQVYKSAHYKELLKRNPLSLFRIIPGLKPSEAPRIAYFFVYPFFSPAVGFGLYIMFSRKGLQSLCTDDFNADLGGYNPLETVRGLLAGRDLSAAERIMYLYARTYLPTLLLQEDKMSMAFSIESRTPICDNTLVDFAARTHIEQKLHRQQLKAITKFAFQDMLPPELYGAPKRGFPTPIAVWFRGPLREMITELFDNSAAVESGVFSRDTLRGLLNRLMMSKTNTLFDYNLASRLYSLMTIELWIRIFERGGWKDLV